jgi:4-alpha-glucanotransferase
VAELSGDLAELCRSVGLEISYLGWRGEAVVSQPEAVLALLSALGPGFGFELNGLDGVRAATAVVQQQRWRSASPVVVAWGGQGVLGVPVQASVDGDWELELHLESGRRERRSGRLYELPASGHTEVEGHTLCRRAIVLPIGGELGYHRAEWRTHSPGAHANAQLSGSCTILAAPERAVPRAGGRPWGVFAPLYGLRSPRSGATGDLTTMRALRQWVAQKGGAYVATLPILAQFLDEAYNISPYGPASRLFWNELYLENEAPPQLAPELRAELAAFADSFAAERRRLSTLPQVDYRSQYAWKRAWLDRVAAACEQSVAIRQAIDQWAAQVPAYDYAMFRAFGEMDGASWHSWTPERKNAASGTGGGVPFAASLEDAVGAGADRGRVWSHVVGQWMMHQQLAKDAIGVAATPVSSGAGLYLDLPVGVNGDAYEVWRHRELFVTQASVGAPPDALFLGGQEWGLPPVHPAMSRATGHRYLRDCLRHHMQAAAMLRIDHVMGLHRLYCVPRGFGAKDGAYLRYPKDELYALITLESHRQRCAIVGEDLGTVPDDVPPALARHHIARLFVSQFEMPQAVGKAPRRSPEGVVASFGTHDMATFSGWWHGADLADRRALGLIGELEEQSQLAQRGVECAALLAHVDSAKLAPPNLPDEERAMGGAMIDLARSPAEVMLVTLEDLWLERAPQNVPGTYHERPNWLRPLTVDAVTLGIEPGPGPGPAPETGGEQPASKPPARLDVIDAVAHVRAQPPAPKS